MTIPPLWDGVLRRLSDEMPAFSLEAWVRPLAVCLDGDVLRLTCPSELHRDRIRERYTKSIARAVERERGAALQISLEVAETGPAAPHGSAPEVPITDSAEPKAIASSAAPPRRSPVALRAVSSPARSREAAASAAAAPAQHNFDYSFASFVVGPCNALAREAALALAQERQHGVSPLYLVSPSGLGKTHLARAAAAESRRARAARAVYTSTEEFTSEFLSSLRAQRMAGFKRRFREECDLLVIEDVQGLRGKAQTQLELFHTLEHLLSVGARVIVTGDRLPRDITDLDPRLASRLTSGLVAEIEPPDAQVRRAILRDRAAAGGVRLPDECLDLLVAGVRGSVRDLEGVLIQLVASSALLKQPIDRELTERALRKLQPDTAGARPLAPEDVIAVVASHFRTTPAALAARSRRRDVVVPRQIAMWLARRYTDASLHRIGEALGREHPAVSHALAVVERQILERAPLRYQIEAISARLDALAGRRGGSPS